MRQNSIDLLWIHDVTDIFYFTGLKVSRGLLLILRDYAYVAVDGRYIEAAKAQCPIPVVLDEQEKAYDFLFDRDIERVGIEYAQTSITQFEQMKKILKAEFIDSNLVAQIRVIKDEKELHYLKESALLCWKGYNFIKSLLDSAMTEKQIAWEFEKYVREEGAEELAFDAIIAFGDNSAYPHYHPAERVRKHNEAALIDIGVKLHHYCSDMTRVVLPLEVPKVMREIQEVVLGAYESALKACRIGVKVSKIDQVARDFIASKGYGEYFSHSLGHGVGLQIHEYPVLSSRAKKESVLQENMVFTIEPGIYIPHVGGYRYENTLYMTSVGPQSFFPHDI